MNAITKLRHAANASGYVEEIPDRHIFRVRRSTFVDEAVLEQERRAIYDKCWLYLGHESELSNPCDFVTRSVGGRELIFNRDRAGKFNVFLNVCPHRGAMLVREAKGNAMAFQCFYHGWAFNVNGRFASRFTDGNYGADHYQGDCANLVEAPRFESYRGFFFVNFSAEGPNLSTYLGAAAREMLDLVSDQGEAGMEIVGGEQQYLINANWKLLAENSADGFHAPQTHSTYMNYMSNIGNLPSDPAVLQQVMAARDPAEGRGVDLGNGHAMIEYSAAWGRPAARWAPAWGDASRDMFKQKRERLIQLYGRERGDRMARLNRNIVIFPNLAINDIMSLTVRTFYPVTPSQMRVSSWALGIKGEPPLAREIRLNNFVEFLGPGGLATPDDVEAIESCQRGYSNLREAPWNDISKGLPRGDQARHEDEEQMRCFWREWDRRIAAGADDEGNGATGRDNGAGDARSA